MKFILFTIIVIFIQNCTLNKVINHHGVHNLDTKKSEFVINTSNKNDIVKSLGPPSTKSFFDKELWIFIERKTSSSKLRRLGTVDIVKNDVLLLEFDNRGILVSQKFFNKDAVNKLKFIDDETSIEYEQNSYIYKFFSILRKKIDDPLGTRRKQIKK